MKHSRKQKTRREPNGYAWRGQRPIPAINKQNATTKPRSSCPRTDMAYVGGSVWAQFNQKQI